MDQGGGCGTRSLPHSDGKRARLEVAEGLSHRRVPRCATTAFTKSKRALQKSATS